MSIHAAYLAIGAKGATLPIMVPEMGRRARGVEVWAALRTLGRSGLSELLERSCAHARRFADGLRQMGFDVVNDVVLNQVVAAPEDPSVVPELVRRIQQSGECWLGPTRWQGRDAIRISVSSWRTDEADVERSLRAIAQAYRDTLSRDGHR
jgi:glutamate/tyrosine decarboxylase-like PLP-dependent enzyme